MSYRITPKLIDRMAKKTIDKQIRRAEKDQKYPARVVWWQSAKSEKSKLRFTLLEAAGWDDRWSVMEWQRLPMPLRKDLEALARNGILYRLVREDTGRLEESTQELKKEAEKHGII